MIIFNKNFGVITGPPKKAEDGKFWFYYMIGNVSNVKRKKFKAKDSLEAWELLIKKIETDSGLGEDN